MGTSYYVIQVFPKAEQDAIDWISDFMRIDAYCPMGSRLLKPRRGHKTAESIRVEMAVFSGYLFLPDSGNMDWLALGVCPYVYGYLCNDGVPALIPEEVIVDIQERVVRGEYEQKDINTPIHGFSVNEAVIIKPGDVTMLGTVIEISSKNLKVEVSVFGRCTSFVVPLNAAFPAHMAITSLNPGND